MRKRVRAIIIDGKSIILMKRVKQGITYWVFPGGEVEKGESKEEALVRECKEELGIDIKVVKFLVKEMFNLYGPQMEYFYLCEKTGGVLGTGDGPEFSRNDEYYGTHEVEKVLVGKVKDVNLLPKKIKKLVCEKIVKIEAPG